MTTKITLRDYKAADRDIDRYDERRGFHIHAIVYTVMNALLFLINMVIMNQTTSDFLWFFFPLVGWGIGLATHYVYGVWMPERRVEERQERVETLATHRMPWVH